MPLLLGLLPLIIDLTVKFLGWILGKSSKSKEAEAIFREFAEKLRAANVITISQQKQAEEQLKAGNDEWDRREKLKATKPVPPKAPVKKP